MRSKMGCPAMSLVYSPSQNVIRLIRKWTTRNPCFSKVVHRCLDFGWNERNKLDLSTRCFPTSALSTEGDTLQLNIVSHSSGGFTSSFPKVVTELHIRCVLLDAPAERRNIFQQTFSIGVCQKCFQLLGSMATDSLNMGLAPQEPANIWVIIDHP